jgi:adenine-specific DNA-methyltransferase
MAEEPTLDKLKMHSPDLSQDNITKIRELFPDCVTEARDEATDKLRLAVDFDQLRQELSDHIVEGPQERYRLDWPGKREALALANMPTAKALRPIPEESSGFFETRNLFIEGDNLDALKLLQENYLGRVKMIYIDPPYNTGGNFIYEDDFREGSQEFLLATAQDAKTGEKLVANRETSGRFHSAWMSFIYPRIKLARNLLRDDGVILVSINDKEQANLRRMCDEIFGEEAFIAQFVWNNEGNVDQQSKIKGVHEYILAYCKDGKQLARPQVIDPNIEETSKLYNDTIENSITKNGPANPESTVTLPEGFPAKFDNGVIEPREDKYPKIMDRIVVDSGRLASAARIRSGWSSRNLLDLFINNGCVPIKDSEGKETWFDLTETGAIYNYKRRTQEQGHVLSVIRNVGTTKQNSAMLSKWGLKFSYPKPVYLLQYLVSVFASDEEENLVLDFFAGSGTMGDAILRQCAEDGLNRNYILIQYPEELSEELGEAKHIKSIADIGKERLRKAGEHILRNNKGRNSNRDVGFRVLKVDTSNMKDVYYRPDELKQSDLLDMVDNVKEDRTAEDLLFQVLVDWGVDLTLPIRRETVQGKTVFFVDDNALVACFDTGITEELVKELAGHEPLRVVFRDNGFVSDAVKINVEQVFRQLSPTTEVRAI